MKKLYILLAAALVACNSYAQPSLDFFGKYYPISDDPNIGYKSNMVPYENILFEANPIVHFSFFNDFYQWVNPRAGQSSHKEAWYLLYKPELRMYTDNSLPVKTPSYRILAGTQHFWVIRDRDLIGFAVESGHYSNGQDGGTFTTQYADGSPQSEAAYQTITPQTNLSALLNRSSGNFSTDETEVTFNYRYNKKLDGNAVPVTTCSFKIGAILYHNRIFGLLPIGGYTQEDISIMGKFRLELGYQYLHTYSNGWRISAAENFEDIFNAHPWVQPLRFESIGTVYPFKKMTDFGLFGTFIWGHDNYNYRFVDSGHQFGLGVSWSLFPPVKVHGSTLK